MHMWIYFFLHVLLLVVVVQRCSAALQELKTTQEIEQFKSQSGTNGIFFYKKEVTDTKPLSSRTVKFMEQAIEFMEEKNQYYAKFAMVNCILPGVKAGNHKECSSERRKVYLYGEHGIEQEYAINELFSAEAFEAKVMLFSYSEYIRIVQNKDDLEYELNQVRGKKDVLFLYDIALGKTGHHQFMMYASENLDRFHFLISTEPSFVMKQFKLDALDSASMWYLNCVALPSSSKDDCEYVRYLGGEIPSASAVETFVSNVDKPIIEAIKEDGRTSFGSEETHVLYAIVDSVADEQRMAEMMQAAILATISQSHLLRGVIVNIERTKDYTTTYGVTSEEGVPTFALEMAGIAKSGERQFDYFPPDNDVNAQNLAVFLKEVISDTERYAHKIADVYYIMDVKLTDWKDAENDSPRLVAGCSNDVHYEDLCEKFNKNYRRLVRTLHLYHQLDLEFFYVDFTGKPRSADNNNIPCIKYNAPGQKEVKFQASNLESAVNMYVEMLKWMNDILGTNMKPLPLSTADIVLLPPQKPADRLNKEHLDERLDHLQDDEIMLDANKVESERVFYKDSVQKLTDETFQKTLNETNFVIMLFYIQFDDRSFLLQPTFAKVNDNLVKASSSVKLAKVDCYQEYETCATQKMFTYPTIAVYSNGEKMKEYNGLFDEESLMRAIELYQHPALVKLTAETLPLYEKGQEEMAFASKVDVAFFGWFASEGTEFDVYKKEAMENYGKYAFACSIAGDTQQLPEGVKLPYVVAYVRNDELRQSVVLMEPFSASSLKRFVTKAAIPLMGELNLSNFPSYKSLGAPFVLLFTDGKNVLNSIEYKGLQLLAKKNQEQTVLYAWMDMEKQVTKTIRRNYVGVSTKRTNDIVLVNHTSSYVYLYNEKKSSADEYVVGIFDWVRECSTQLVKPISHLNRQKFKPLREGFDFLYFQDNNIGGPHGKSLHEINQEMHEGASNQGVGMSVSEDMNDKFTTLHGVNLHHMGGVGEEEEAGEPTTTPSEEEQMQHVEQLKQVYDQEEDENAEHYQKAPSHIEL